MVHRPSLIICSLLVALLLPTRPARGEGCPAARITFESGRVIHAEILSFANGRFQLRDTQTGKKFAALDDDIESIEFGKVPVGVAPAKKPEPAATAKKPKPAATAKKPKPITPPEKPKPWQPTGETTAFWRVVEQGDHEKLTWRIISMTRLKGNESVLAFEGELLARMRERDITREKRRDMQLALAVAWLVIRPVAITLLNLSSTHEYGLLGWFDLPWGLEFAIGFLLMDLSFYYWHRANHRIGLFWRFHNVHHVDADMDVTTALRFHPGENAYSALFRAAQIALIGATPLLYAVYEFFFLANTFFHHANLRLPIRFERVLNWFIVTPRMHTIHHSTVRGETNSNYSSLFRWWDLLHGTLVLNVPQDRIVIGVPGYTGPENSSIVPLLAMPFARQKEYPPPPDPPASGPKDNQPGFPG